MVGNDAAGTTVTLRPTPPAEAIGVLFELIGSLDVWGLGHSVAIGMIGALHTAIREDGLPEAVNSKELAEFVDQAFAQDESGFFGANA